MLSSGDLPIDVSDQAGTGIGSNFTIRLGASLKEVEAELIFRTLASVGGNKTRAARILGVARRSMYNLLERHNGHAATGPPNGEGYRNG
jgi:DNA-binding NtrC family response regulator